MFHTKHGNKTMNQSLYDALHSQYTTAQFRVENPSNLPVLVQVFYQFTPMAKGCLLMTPSALSFHREGL